MYEAAIERSWCWHKKFRTSMMFADGSWTSCEAIALFFMYLTKLRNICTWDLERDICKRENYED